MSQTLAIAIPFAPGKQEPDEELSLARATAAPFGDVISIGLVETRENEPGPGLSMDIFHAEIAER